MIVIKCKSKNKDKKDDLDFNGFQIQFNPIGDRIVASFFTPKYNTDGKLDLNESHKVYFRDFAKTFAVFRQVSRGKPNNLNSKEHKVKKCHFNSNLMGRTKKVEKHKCNG